MINELRHIGLVVSDLERSLFFWCEIMGFLIIRKMDESGSHVNQMMGLNNVKVTTVKLKSSNGSLLEILYFHSHPDKPMWEGTPYSTGLTHIALTVEDLDQTLRQILMHYPSPDTCSPQFSPDGKVKVVYTRGPENLLLELVQVL